MINLTKITYQVFMLDTDDLELKVIFITGDLARAITKAQDIATNNPHVVIFDSMRQLKFKHIQAIKNMLLPC